MQKHSQKPATSVAQNPTVATATPASSEAPCSLRTVLGTSVPPVRVRSHTGSTDPKVTSSEVTKPTTFSTENTTVSTETSSVSTETKVIVPTGTIKKNLSMRSSLKKQPSLRKVSSTKLTFLTGSLLKAPENLVLVHSIGRDQHLGAGIAKEIEKTFSVKKQMKYQPVGTAIITSHPRLVAHLVTKKHSWKADSTLRSFESALCDLLRQTTRPMAFPMIESGLNGHDFFRDILPIITRHVENPTFFSLKRWNIPTSLFEKFDIQGDVTKPTLKSISKQWKFIKTPNLREHPLLVTKKTTHHQAPVYDSTPRNTFADERVTTKVVIPSPVQFPSYFSSAPVIEINFMCKDHVLVPQRTKQIKNRASFVRGHACNSQCCNKHQYRWKEETTSKQRRTLERVSLQSDTQSSQIVNVLKDWLASSFGVSPHGMITYATQLTNIVAALVTLANTSEVLTKTSNSIILVSSLVEILSRIIEEKTTFAAPKGAVEEIVAEVFQEHTQPIIAPTPPPIPQSHLIYDEERQTMIQSDDIGNDFGKTYSRIKMAYLSHDFNNMAYDEKIIKIDSYINELKALKRDCKITALSKKIERSILHLNSIRDILPEVSSPTPVMFPTKSETPLPTVAFPTPEPQVVSVTPEIVTASSSPQPSTSQESEVEEGPPPPKELPKVSKVSPKDCLHNYDQAKTLLINQADEIKLRCPICMDFLQLTKENELYFYHRFNYVIDSLNEATCSKVQYEAFQNEYDNVVSFFPDEEYADEDIAEKAVEQSDSQKIPSWLPSVVTSVIMGLGAMFLAAISKQFKIVKNIKEGLSLMKSLGDVASEHVYGRLRDIVAASFLGNEDPILQTRNSISNEIQELTVLENKPLDRLIDEPTFVSDFNDKLNHAKVMYRDLSHRKEFNNLTIALNRKIETADRRYGEIQRAISTLGIKEVPVCIVMSGEKGIGKTTCNSTMGQQFSQKFFKTPEVYVHDCVNKFFKPYLGQRVMVVQELGAMSDLKDDIFIHSFNSLSSGITTNMEGAFVKDQSAQFEFIFMDTNLSLAEFHNALPLNTGAKQGTLDRITWFDVQWNKNVPIGTDKRGFRNYKDDYSHLTFVPMCLDSTGSNAETTTLKVDGSILTTLTYAQVKAYIEQVREQYKRNASRLVDRRARLRQMDSLNNQAVLQANYNHTVVHLYGEPGEGKSTFIKSFIREVQRKIPLTSIEVDFQKLLLGYYTSDKSPIKNNMDPKLIILDDILTQNNMETLSVELERNLMDLYNNLPPDCVILVATNIQPVLIGTTLPSPSVTTTWGYQVPCASVEKVYQAIFKNTGMYRRMGYNGHFLKSKGIGGVYHSSKYTTSNCPHNYSVKSFQLFKDNVPEMLEEGAQRVASQYVETLKRVKQISFHPMPASLPVKPLINIKCANWDDFIDLLGNMTPLSFLNETRISVDPSIIIKCKDIRITDVAIPIPNVYSDKIVQNIVRHFGQVFTRYGIDVPTYVEISDLCRAYYAENQYYFENKRTNSIAPSFSIATSPDSTVLYLYDIITNNVVHKLTVLEYYRMFISKTPDVNLYLTIDPIYVEAYKTLEVPMSARAELGLLESKETTTLWSAQLSGFVHKAWEFVLKYKWYFLGLTSLVAIFTTIYMMCKKNVKYDHSKYATWLFLTENNIDVPEDLENYITSLPRDEIMANRNKIRGLYKNLGITAEQKKKKRKTGFVPTDRSGSPMMMDPEDFNNFGNSTLKDLSTARKFKEGLKAMDDIPTHDLGWGDDDSFDYEETLTFAKNKAILEKRKRRRGSPRAIPLDPIQNQTVSFAWHTEPCQTSMEQKHKLVKRNLCTIETGLGKCFGWGLYDSYLVTVGHICALKGNKFQDYATVDMDEAIVKAKLVYVNMFKDISIWKTERPVFKDLRKWLYPDSTKLHPDTECTFVRQHEDKQIFLQTKLQRLYESKMLNIGNKATERQNLIDFSFTCPPEERPTGTGDCGQLYYINNTRDGEPFIIALHALGYTNDPKTGGMILDAKTIEYCLANVEEQTTCIGCSDTLGGKKASFSDEEITFSETIHQHFVDTPQLVGYQPKNHNDGIKLLKEGLQRKECKTSFYMNCGPNAENSIEHVHFHIYKNLNTRKWNDIKNFMMAFDISIMRMKNKQHLEQFETWYLLKSQDFDKVLTTNRFQIFGLWVNEVQKFFGVRINDGKYNAAFFSSLPQEALIECKLDDFCPKSDSIPNGFVGRIYAHQNHFHSVSQKAVNFEKLKEPIDFSKPQNAIFKKTSKGFLKALEDAGTESKETYEKKLMEELRRANERIGQKEPAYKPHTSLKLLGVTEPVMLPHRYQHVKTPFSKLLSSFIPATKAPFKSIKDCTTEELFSLTNTESGKPSQLINQIEMLDFERKYMTPKECRVIASRMLPWFLSTYGKHCKFATYDEVLNGGNSINCPLGLRNSFSPLATDAGGGIALKKLYNIALKSQVIEIKEDGTRVWRDNEPAQETKEYFFKACEDIKEGRRPCVLFQTLTKVELLGLEKAYKGRVYEAEDLIGVLLERYVFGRLVAYSSSYKINEHVRVGMDPNKHFDSMTRYHLEFNCHWSGDFSRWDKRVSLSLPVILTKLMTKSHSMLYHQGQECDCGWEQACKTMIRSSFTSIRFIQNAYYQTDGMPSGTYLTAVFNSFFVQILLYSAYVFLGKNKVRDTTFGRFLKYIRTSGYGDDTLVSTSTEISQWYNLETVGIWCKERLGIILDSDKKDGKIIPYYNDISETSFISRTPMPCQNGIFLGALKKTTIESWLHWNRKQTTPEETTEVIVSNMQSALWEAAAWGREYYELISHALSVVLACYPIFGESVTIFDFDDIMDYHYLNVRGVRIARLPIHKKNINMQSQTTSSGNYAELSRLCSEKNLKFQLIYPSVDTAAITIHGADASYVIRKKGPTSKLAAELAIDTAITRVKTCNKDINGHFIKNFFSAHLYFARKVAEKLGATEVYITSINNYFADAKQCTIDSVRYVEKDGMVGVISSTLEKQGLSDYEKSILIEEAPYEIVSDEYGYRINFEISEQCTPGCAWSDDRMCHHVRQIISSIYQEAEQEGRTYQVLPEVAELQMDNHGNLNSMVSDIATPSMPNPPVATNDSDFSTSIPIGGIKPRQKLPNVYNWDAFTTFLNGVHSISDYDLTVDTGIGMIASYSLDPSKGTLSSDLKKWIDGHKYWTGGVTVMIDITSPSGTKGKLGFAMTPIDSFGMTWANVRLSYPYKEISLDGDSTFQFELRRTPNENFANSSSTSSDFVGYVESVGCLYLTVPVASTYNATASDLLVKIRAVCKPTMDFRCSVPLQTLPNIFSSTYLLESERTRKIPLENTWGKNYTPNVAIIIGDNNHSTNAPEILYRTEVWSEFEQQSVTRFNPGNCAQWLCTINAPQTDKITANSEVWCCGHIPANLSLSMKTLITVDQGVTLNAAFMNILADTYGNVVRVNPIVLQDIQRKFKVAGMLGNLAIETGQYVIRNESYYVAWGYTGFAIFMVTESTSRVMGNLGMYTDDGVTEFTDITTRDSSYPSGGFKGLLTMGDHCWGTAPLAPPFITKTVGDYDVITGQQNSITTYGERATMLTCDKVDYIDSMSRNGFQVIGWQSNSVEHYPYKTLVLGMNNQSTSLSAGECMVPSEAHFQLLRSLEDMYSEDTVLNMSISNRVIGPVLFRPGKGLFISTTDTFVMMPNVNVEEIEFTSNRSGNLTAANTADFVAFQSSAKLRKLEMAQLQSESLEGLEKCELQAASIASGLLGGLASGISSYYNNKREDEYREKQMAFQKEQQELTGQQTLDQISLQGENTLANTTLAGQNQLANTTLTGQNTLANTELTGKNQTTNIKTQADMSLRNAGLLSAGVASSGQAAQIRTSGGGEDTGTNSASTTTSVEGSTSDDTEA